MKKTLSALLCALMVLSLCSASAAAETAKPLHIVCTAFPQYDWARNVLGDDAANVKLTLLMDSGVDLHNYQPTAQDIIAISTCDLFVYVGGESDGWVEQVLAAAQNPNLKAISMLACVEAKEEETVEGMEHEHDHDHEDEHDDEHEKAEYDEHVWLSLRFAQTLTRQIADALCALRPANAATYEANAAAYVSRLSDLDARYQAAVDGAARTTLLFADRFPFRYLADDYGLAYYAAFSGCSAESEASFETIAFLAGKADELDLPAVLTLEGANHSIAQTVVASTQKKNQRILSLNSLQSVTAKQVNEGADYLQMMEENLDELKIALN